MQNIVGWIKVPLTDSEKLMSQEVALGQYCKANPKCLDFIIDYKSDLNA